MLPRPGKRPPLISSPLGQVKNYTHAKQLPVASRPSVFQSPDEDDEEDYEQWLEIKGKVQGLLPTVHSCSSSSTGRLHGPGESAAGCGLLGAVVRALPPCLQAEPRVRVRPFGMREVKEEVRSRPWGAWKGCRERAASGSRLAHCPLLWGLVSMVGWRSQGSVHLCTPHPVLEEERLSVA